MEIIDLKEIFNQYVSQSNIFTNKNALSHKFIPDKLPHREFEIKELAKILAPSLRNEPVSNVLIFGKPGTGKTLVVKYVTKELEKIALKRNVPLSVIYLNCKLRKVADTEYRLYAYLANFFGRKVPHTGLATQYVFREFVDALEKSRKQVILILDEVDTLVNKIGDEFLYVLSRLNNELDYSRLSFIGISNNIFFYNSLDSRVKSSLNEEKIVFKPYNAKELKDILYDRAKLAFKQGALDEGVIEKCAAYSARNHGDARRAIDLLRIAGEIAERNGDVKVREIHVDLADEKLEKDKILEIISSLPIQSLLVLYSIIFLYKEREPPYFTGEIYNVYNRVAKSFGFRALTQRRVSDLINELDDLGILNAEVISKGRYGRTRKINLAIPDSLLVEIEKEIGKVLS